MKYCAGIDTLNRMVFLYNGLQDQEISSYGIPNIPPERQIQPFKDKGIELKYHNTYIIEDNVLVAVDRNDKRTLRIATIPENVEIIGKIAFESSLIEEVAFSGNNLKEIRSGAFMSCNRLQNLSIPEGVETLGTGILLNSGVEKVVVPSSVTEIPKRFCAYCDKLKSVVLPATIKSIADDAFEYSDNVILEDGNDYMIEYANQHGIKYINPDTGEIMNMKR